ncbi:hypothetical protein ACF06W_11825 [Streptomyces albus]|uniref:hypothetical protein n=1 Tax=Streptomyces albus TaxID=1888 RepID=UPI0036FC0489
MAERKLSPAKLRGLRAAAADRLGCFPSDTSVTTTNSLRDAGLAVNRDRCGHQVGPGHRHEPIRSFITLAGRDVVGAPHPPALTAAGTELELRCRSDLEQAGYTERFTVVELAGPGEGVFIEMEPADEVQLLVMTSSLYANGWRELDELDGLYPVPLVASGEKGKSAGMCQQCGMNLMYDESGSCVTDEFGGYMCRSAQHRVSPTHILWE